MGSKLGMLYLYGKGGRIGAFEEGTAGYQNIGAVLTADLAGFHIHPSVYL
jgi:hypothetical protein